METALKGKSKWANITTQNDKTSNTEILIQYPETLEAKRILDSIIFTQIGLQKPNLRGYIKVIKMEFLWGLFSKCAIRPVAGAKWLTRVLEPLRQMAKGSLKNTTELINSVKEFNMKRWQMFSLDVTSIFTDVSIKNHRIPWGPLHEEWFSNNSSDWELETTVAFLYLRCPVQIYQSNIPANWSWSIGVSTKSLVRQHFQVKSWKMIQANRQSTPSVYANVVYDTSCVLNSSTRNKRLLSSFNSDQANVKFTTEMKSSSEMAFSEV